MEVSVHDAAPREQTIVTDGYFLHAPETRISDHDPIANDNPSLWGVCPWCGMTKDDDVIAEDDLARSTHVKTAEDTKVSARTKPPAGGLVPSLVPKAAREGEARTKCPRWLTNRAEVFLGTQQNVTG